MRLVLSLALLALPALPALGKKPDLAGVATVPSIADVVAAEGFIPTPSHSEIYRPGAVLVPNGRGGHDVVVSSCIDAEPDIAIMSQSSIATTLAGGVSARLGAVRGAASAGVEKRLSFVDPEQRAIPLAKMRPTDECASGVMTAGTLQDLSSAIVLHDVLVAIIKNTVCTRADAAGGVVALGAAEAAAYSECVQESDGQVPLGYKGVPLDKVLSLAGGPVASGSPAASSPGSVSGAVGFGQLGSLDVDARLKEQACADAAREGGLAARAARLDAAELTQQEQARAAWQRISGQLDKCTHLPHGARGDCIAMVEMWLSQAAAMRVSVDAGVETVQTACGPRESVFGAQSRPVVVAEVVTAEALRARLSAADAPEGAVTGTGQLGYAMVRVPAGQYTRGCTDGQVGFCHKGEKPTHGVTVTRDLWVGRTEVTQGLYTAVVGSSPHRFEGCGDTCPVETVSWFDAVRFANAMSALEGLEACYVVDGTEVQWPKGLSCAGYRLPTEAEWEYFARAGDDRPYGHTVDVDVVGWTVSNSAGRPHVVGEKQPNAWGLYDTVGNVWEWTWDWQVRYRSKPLTDPMGPAEAPKQDPRRVLRGGSWVMFPSVATVATRNGHAPDRADSNTGLRLVRTATE